MTAHDDTVVTLIMVIFFLGIPWFLGTIPGTFWDIPGTVSPVLLNLKNQDVFYSFPKWCRKMSKNASFWSALFGEGSWNSVPWWCKSTERGGPCFSTYELFENLKIDAWKQKQAHWNWVNLRVLWKNRKKSAMIVFWWQFDPFPKCGRKMVQNASFWTAIFRKKSWDSWLSIGKSIASYAFLNSA